MNPTDNCLIRYDVLCVRILPCLTADADATGSCSCLFFFSLFSFFLVMRSSHGLTLELGLLGQLEYKRDIIREIICRGREGHQELGLKLGQVVCCL